MEERKYEGYYSKEDVARAVLDRKQGDIDKVIKQITESMKEKENEERTH